MISNNRLERVEDIAHLKECTNIACLDLKGNLLEDPDVVEVFAAMPSLKVLYLQGNPVVRKIRHYRKTLISRLPELTYLDDRPVFPEERERVEAWAAGLAEGGLKEANQREREMIETQKLRKRERDERNFRAFEEMMRKGISKEEEDTRKDAFLSSAEAATDQVRAEASAAAGTAVDPPPLPESAWVEASAAAEAAMASLRRESLGETEQKESEDPPASASVPAAVSVAAPTPEEYDVSLPGGDVAASHVLEPPRSGTEAATRSFAQGRAGIGGLEFARSMASAGGAAPAVEVSLPEQPELQRARERRLQGSLLGGTARLDPRSDADKWEGKGPVKAAKKGDVWDDADLDRAGPPPSVATLSIGPSEDDVAASRAVQGSDMDDMD
jgi:hypothetical protein